MVDTPTTIADHMTAPISDYCDDHSVGRTSPEVCVVGTRDTTTAEVARIKSAGRSTICRPRRPPFTTISSRLSALASMKVRRRFLCPRALIPPTTYPVVRSAFFGSESSAFLAPAAEAIALRVKRALDGMIAQTSSPESRATTSVLKTVEGRRPSARAA